MRSIYGEVNFPFSFCFLSSSIASAVGFRGRFCTDASTGAAQMFRQLLRRCFGSCCADASAGASTGASAGAVQMLRQLLRRCFGSCCSDASADAAQMLWQELRRCFGRCCSDVSAVAAQMFRQVLRPGCERCLACGHRSGVECRDKGNGVAGNIMSINEISILVVRYCAPRECLC